jgi:hypothetical protein
MLAITLFLDKYTANDVLKSDRNDIETKWLARWKDALGHPAPSP